MLRKEDRVKNQTPHDPTENGHKVSSKLVKCCWFQYLVCDHVAWCWYAIDYFDLFHVIRFF